MKSDKRIFRIICLVLAALFVLTVFGSAITIIADAATSYSADMQVRVGIVYGSSSPSTYTFTVTNGISVGIMTDPRTFKKLGEYPSVRTATVLLEKNLTVDGTTVGNYHLQESGSYTSYAKAYAVVSKLADAGTKAYVAYISGTFRVRTGAYSSSDAATSAKSSMPSGYTFKVVSGSGNGMVLYDTGAKKIIFQCDTTDVYMGVRALQKTGDTKTSYIKAPTANLYDGVFEFAYKSSGIRVVNILDLDSYALGVCPWEIIPSWPEETLKAFAVTIRTLAVYHYGARHTSSYGFDICTTSHCQNYKGMAKDYDSFRKAVAATSGQIATYKGKAIMGIYHGTNGGVTEDVRDIWGQNVEYPYLVSVTIPIEVESCKDQPKGVWTSTVTPKELSSYISSNTSALKSLTSPIVALNIKQYSKYSGVYIYELEFVDSAGHSASVKTSSSVRSALVKYCPSAYFSISYNYKMSVQTADGVKSGSYNGNNCKVLTASGEEDLSGTTPQKMTVLTADGAKSYSTDDFTIQFDGKGNGHGGGISMYGAVDLAKAGYKYDEILKTYFTGIDVTDLGDPVAVRDYCDDGVDDGNDDDIGTGEPEEISDFSPVYEIVTTTANVNIRSGASTSSSIVKTVSKGTELVRTGIGKSGFDRVYLSDGTVAYVTQGGIKKNEVQPSDAFTPVCDKVITTANVNAREGPSTSTKILFAATQGTIYTRTGIGSDGFDRITTSEGKVIYFSATYLKPVSESDNKFTDTNDIVIATASSVNMRSEPNENANVLDTVAKGSAIVRTGIGEGSFDRVLTSDGKTAYVLKTSVSADVKPDDGFTVSDDVVVTTAKVNLREEPNTSAAIVATLDSGTELTRTGIGSDGFDRVIAPSGKVAYVTQGGIRSQSAPTYTFTDVNETVITTSGVNMRKLPSLDGSIIATVAKDTELTRTGIGSDGFDRVVTASGVLGYISSSYLRKKDAAPDDAFTATDEVVETTSNVNMRESPSTSGTLIKKLDKGTLLFRIGKGSGDFDKIMRSDGSIAYVSGSYLKVKTDFDGFVDMLDTVSATTTVNLRSEPSAESASVGRVTAGTKLVRTGKGGNGFDRIKLSDGSTAYISNKYIEKVQ